MRKRAKFKLDQPPCNVDPNIFSCLDLGNSAGSSGDQVDFNWVDEFITSTETCEPSDGEGPSSGQDASSAAISIQQAAPVQQQQQQPQQQQQQLLQNVLQQQQQPQVPQQQTPTMGKVIMAVGQSSQQQTLAVAASDSSTATQQLLSTNQTQLLHSSVGGQPIAQPYILKASNPIQLVTSSVSQSTAGMGSAPQQFVPAASGLSSISASQSSSPLLNRSMTPNLTSTTTHTTSQLPAINLLHVQQPQQLTQTLPLSNFVANQQNLQGHAVLTAQGSNIVHTQNALIQNPNVVNVNVAHVLPNHQLPQLQVLQTPQGKIYVQSPAGNQALPQQLCLGQVAGAQPVQMAGSQAVQMASQPVQLASAQTMQVASNVGLAQPAAAVIAHPQSNVALGNNNGVGQQQASLNFINIGGSQGQILLQRMPSASTVTQAQPLTQGPIFLRTINGQQQLIQQPTLQSSPATTQLPKPQQLVTQQAGTPQNIPLQQLLTGVGGSPLRLVGPTAVSTSQVSSLSSTSSSTTPSIVLQPFVTTNQVPLLGQQVSTQAGSKSGTVTLNLGGQNLNLHQLQNLSALQLSSSQPQSIIVQQQQQQQQVTVQHTVVQTPSVKVSAGSSSKKSKSKNSLTSSTASSSASSSVPAMSADNILSAALMSSGILDDEELQSLMNGSDMSDGTLMPSEVAITPSPSSVCTTQTPTPPPPPTPPTTVTKKSKKKKKEVGGNVLQHVVLSSTAMKSTITITTASATTVTTTLSQSALSAQTLSMSTSSLISTPLASMSANSSILSNLSQLAATTTSVPTLPTLPTASLPAPVSSISCSTSGRGKQGPPNVTVKGLGSLQGLSAEDMQELFSIQTSLNKLREQPSLDQSSLALMQQLDMKRRKILAAHSNTQVVKLQQQQQQQQGQQAEQRMGAGTMQIRLQGQSVTTHIPPDTSSQQTVATQASSMQTKMAQAIVPLQSLGTQGQTTLQLAAQPATVQLDVKPVVGTPSNPVLQIQPKSNSKLTLVSPKAEPAASQTRVGDSAVDIKPVLGVGGLEIAHTSSASSQGSTFPTGTGKVIMAMPNPPTPGRAASNQPNVLRIQIGGHTAQPAAFPKASTTPVTTTTHQTILPSTHKVGMSGSAVTTVTTSVTSSPAVSHMPAVSVSPNQARPVQIKIANQLLTVQLTQQQQEKLELHLSRMTLEQQQAFLRQQQHILAKLQHRVDSHSTSQASTTQNSAVTAGSELPAASAAVTVKAPAPASVDTTPAPVQQGVQVMNTASSLATTPAQQLPATVQALVGSQPKTERSKQGTGTSSTPTNSALRCLNMDIPKSSMIHSQLSKDQEHATTPDTMTHFKDNREACRRLLRYHVHQSHEPIDQFDEFDENYNTYCEDLIVRKDGMLSKFQQLLLQDSQQKYPTAEQVQISRMWCNEMTTLVREERELVKNDPDAFIPMPLSYLEKDLTKTEDESSEEEEEERYPPSEEEEEENRHEESEEAEQVAESPVQETTSGKEDIEAPEPSPQDYFHSSPYHSYGAGDPGPPRPEAEEDTAGWEQPQEFIDPVWDESSDKDHVGDVFSEIEPDQLHSSFNDSFEASTPVREEHDLTHSSPLHDSSFAAEEQCSFQSESSRSSPPRPEPATRTVVKLVIRTDSSGTLTSKLLEKRRSSDAGERRSLRKRSHSGHEREVKKVKKEPVMEEVEYIDVDNSKYSKGVSVKLERLSERTSQVYGLNITGKASSSVLAGGAQKTSADIAGSSVTSASSCGSKSGGKSGRKRRGGEMMSSGGSRKVKKESDFSGVKTSDCDRPSDSVFREVKEESGFYVGSAMESLDHFDSEDEDDMGRHYGGGRMGQSVIDIKREVPAHSASSRHPSARNSVSSLAESGGKGLGQSQRSFEDLTGVSSMDSQEMEDHMFAHPHSESRLHGHRRRENNSRRTLDTSFDLDSADPQRSMVNPQVQSAIDSILNSSGSSDLYDGGAAASEMAHVRPRYEAGGSSMSNSRHGASSHRWDQERSHHNDLSTDVHSILR